MLLHSYLLLVYNMTYIISINSGLYGFIPMLFSFNLSEIRYVVTKDFNVAKMTILLFADINERMTLYTFTILATFVSRWHKVEHFQSESGHLDQFGTDCSLRNDYRL